MTFETHQQQVELPNSKMLKKKNPSKSTPLPDIDHTIKIPERMAASCWKAILICSIITVIAFLDSRDPQFRTSVASATQEMVYRFSLEEVLDSSTKVYQSLVKKTVYIITGEQG